MSTEQLILAVSPLKESDGQASQGKHGEVTVMFS